MRLLRDKIIDSEEAYSKCVNKSKFREFLSEPPQDFTEV
jgi:twitching motility protein PilT